ncbi:MAG: hypothetical protein ACRYFS_15445 [Janthinobacterium lividum]
MKIYHQVGHNQTWNVQSFQKDHVGDGLILSPRHMKRSVVEALSPLIKKKSLFDPQWFFPNIPKGSLGDYDFFPDKMPGGFVTEAYQDTAAFESAKRCVDFQLKNSFESIIIPTRYKPGTPTDFIAKMDAHFVKPFLKALAECGSSVDVILQLVLNENMVKDKAYSAEILNWLTGIPQISGIYLVTEVYPRRKQLDDIEFLLALLDFVSAVRSNDLSVILGYLNTESLLLSLASPSAVTVGSFEKTRNFYATNFKDIDLGERSPNPRLYVAQVLQNVEYNYVNPIKMLLNDQDFFDDTLYREKILDSKYKPHFSKPDLYKHSFIVLFRQLQAIAARSGKERYDYVSNLFVHASHMFSVIEQKGVVLGADSKGDHLPAWMTVANIYAKEQGWK